MQIDLKCFAGCCLEHPDRAERATRSGIRHQVEQPRDIARRG
jgi:hypothetical protein